MPTLTITEPGLVVCMDRGRIRVDRKQQLIGSYPIETIDSLVACAGVEVSRYVIEALAARGGSTLLLDSRHQPVATCLPAQRRDARLRILQVRAMSDESERLRYAKRIVQDKLRSQRALLLTRRGEATCQAVSRIERMLWRCSAARDVANLVALEGAAASTYFRAISSCLPEGWWLGKRSRQPPRDPFNALLSLGYSALAHRFEVHCLLEGLDPDIGFLHCSHRRHPSLCLDLMEPFRATVTDRWVLNLVSRRTVSLNDFDLDELGCRLSHSALRRVFQALETMMDQRLLGETGAATARHALIQAPRRLAEALRKGP